MGCQCALILERACRKGRPTAAAAADPGDPLSGASAPSPSCRTHRALHAAGT